MTTITVKAHGEEAVDAVTHVFEDWQETVADETVSQYVGRVRKEFDRAIHEISQMEGFGRDNHSDHMLTVTCPEMDGVRELIGDRRGAHAPRSSDPTSFRRYAVQGLTHGAAQVCGKLEKLLNGEQVEA
jgi:hypothetical protein